MLCANLEGASLVSCNFDDPAGSAANMEGVNLKEATLEGSNMARVNLRQSCKKIIQTLDTTCKFAMLCYIENFEIQVWWNQSNH